jgi:integrase/recombinase XerD
MVNFQGPDCTIAVFTATYEHYLQAARGFADNSCKLHLRVVGNLLRTCFPAGEICWRDLKFSDLADFLTKEFRRLPNQWTQKAWLVAIRNVVRYLASQGQIPSGWEEALPKRVNWKMAHLPRCISNEELLLLWGACRDKTHRHLRDRALLLVFARLGLRTEEVARLNLKDVDWKNGQVLIRSTKVRRERILPLPQEVGNGLVKHLRARPQKSPQLFAPQHPPFTEQRSRNHVHNCMTALFKRAGLAHTRVHSLRHTAATQMVNRGATFKEIADVLGHKSLTSTLIYAKLDMNALAKVCLPWPGGAQ